MNKSFILLVFSFLLILPSLNALTCNSGDTSSVCYITSAQNFTDGEIFSGTGNLVISAAVYNYTARQSLILNFSAITLNGSGSITGGNISIIANNLTIDSGRYISSYALGYTSATGPGAGSNANYDGGGGGHGGRGSTGYYYGGSEGSGGTNYYCSLSPFEYGSAGGNAVHTWYRYGGYGGGKIKINLTDTLTLNGYISSNGEAGNAYGNRASGGGAGGSIWITTNTINGSGNLTARGAIGGSQTDSYGGGGSGGRIAVYYNTSTWSGLSTSDVNGAAANGGASAAFDGTFIFIDVDSNNITIKQGFTENDNCTDTSFYNTTKKLWNFANYNVSMININTYSRANVSMYAPYLTQTGKFSITFGGSYNALNITASNFTLDSNSVVALDGVGFTSGLGPGAGGANYYSGGGGGYGGVGGRGWWDGGYTGSGGSANGDYLLNTLNFGSGGGTGGAGTVPGGTGGGICIFNITGTFNMSGNISVNGGTGYGGGNNRAGGAGSAGALKITTSNLIGNGNLFAVGGTGGQQSSVHGGGGGGGRIAIHSTNISFTGLMSVAGGTGPLQAEEGYPGTIYTLTIPTYYPSGSYDNSGYYYFSGMSDYIESIISSALTDYTISAWIKNSTAASWSHVVWASDNVNYTDGIVSNPSQKPVYISSTTVQIGKMDSSTYFRGYIDDVKIYPRILTASEVSNLYNGTINNSNYIGKYARQGDFKSLVFYNSTSAYWNITLSQADTYSTRTGIVNNKNEINLSHPNLVSYWALDNNFRDAKGINNGTCSGTACPNNATGLSSNAMRFDGVNDNVTIPDSSSLEPSSVFTISAWINKGATGGSVYPMIMHKGSYGGGDGYNGYFIRVKTDNTIQGYLVTGTNTEYSLSTTQTITNNQWAHILMVYNGSLQRIYINGIESKNQSASGTMDYIGGGQDLKIGYSTPNGDPTNTYFNGTIDEVLIYNTSLTLSQIQQLYKSGLSQHANTNITLQTRTADNYNISDSNLIALWGFNNDNATNIFDELGRDNGTKTMTNNLPSNSYGLVGKGYYFDENDDYITGGNYANWTNFTVAFWAYPMSTNYGGSMPINIYPSSALVVWRIRLDVQYLQLEVSDDGYYDGGPTHFLSYTHSLGQRWMYVVATYRANDKRIYINGNLVANSTNTPASLYYSNNSKLYIGANTYMGSNPVNEYKGYLDEVRIYNRSLSASEIQDLYNLGSYHINWNNGGAWSSASAVSDGVPTSTSSSGKFMQFKTYLYSNTTEISPYVINHSVQTINTVPNVTQVLLNSTNIASNETSQNLTCYANITDINGNSVYANYTWFNNSVEVVSLRGQSGPYSAGTLNLVSTVTSGNLSGNWNKSWTCSVRGYDGMGYSDFVNSSNLIILDLTNPNITLNTPANNSYVNSGFVNVTANFSDESSGILNVTLFVFNQTSLVNRTTVINAVSGTLTSNIGILVNFTEGSYNWFYDAYDNAGNYYSSAYNYTLTVDLTYPSLNFTSPTPSNNSGVPIGGFVVNVTIYDVNFANLTYRFSNNTASLIFTALNTSYITDLGDGSYIFNITQSGISIGNNYTFNVTVCDKVNFCNTTETRYVTGNSAPVVESRTNSPDTNSSLDPGTIISVIANISDSDYNQDYTRVYLQWKNSSSDWNSAVNISMTNASAVNSSTLSVLYNTSFSVPYEANITYRIAAYDTPGSVGYSSLEKNLYILWDCTWDTTTGDIASQYSFLTKTGYSTNKNIGNITLMNTGDPQYSNNNCSLVLEVTHNIGSTTKLYFNDSNIKPIHPVVAAGKNSTLRINYSFGSVVDSSENAVITVSDYNSRSSISSLNTTATFLVRQSGPYLDVAASSDSSVYLRDVPFTIQGYTKNVIGDGTQNNTAYNVTEYWVIPSGFSNQSGITNQTNSSLSDDSPSYLNINLSFVNLAGMSQGSQTFTLSSYGYSNSTGSMSLITDTNNNTLFSKSLSVVFLCYNETKDSICVTSCGYSLDPDCTQQAASTTITPAAAASGSGGGGGSGNTGSSGGGYVEKLLQTQSIYELVRGKDNQFILTVENPFDGTLNDVKIDIAGFMSQYFEVTPEEIDGIKINDSANFTIWILAPKYFTKGTYNLNFTITGFIEKTGGEGNNTWLSVKKMKESRLIVLEIHEVSRQEAEDYLNNISQIIREMSDFNTAPLNELYTRANKSFSQRDYENIKIIYEEVKKDRDSAVSAGILIQDIENRIAEAGVEGIKLPKTERLLLLAKSALERGDYIVSLERANDAKITFALERIGKINIIKFISNNFVEIIAGMAVLGIASYLIILLIRFRIIKHKLKTLFKEENVLFGLIKEIQKDCFERGKLTMKEYHESLLQYEKRMSQVIQDIIKLETLRINMFKLFKPESKRLVEEKTRLSNLIKKTQELYLMAGKMETRVYENRMRSYTERFVEIEERLADLEAEQAMKHIKKRIGLLTLLKSFFEKKDAEMIKTEDIKKRSDKKIKIDIPKVDIRKLYSKISDYFVYAMFATTAIIVAGLSIKELIIGVILNKSIHEMLSPAKIDYSLFIILASILLVSMMILAAAILLRNNIKVLFSKIFIVLKNNRKIIIILLILMIISVLSLGIYKISKVMPFVGEIFDSAYEKTDDVLISAGDSIKTNSKEIYSKAKDWIDVLNDKFIAIIVGSLGFCIVLAITIVKFPSKKKVVSDFNKAIIGVEDSLQKKDIKSLKKAHKDMIRAYNKIINSDRIPHSGKKIIYDKINEVNDHIKKEVKR